MKIGDKKIREKWILHKVMFPKDSTDRDEFVLVTVVEAREVPVIFGQGTGIGVRAIAEDGREFRCNWDRFPDDSSTPYWSWDYRDEHGNFEEWFDVTTGLLARVERKPIFVDKWSDIIYWCPIHLMLWYRGDKSDPIELQGCMYCFFEQKNSKEISRPPQKHWNGWFEEWK